MFLPPPTPATLRFPAGSTSGLPDNPSFMHTVMLMLMCHVHIRIHVHRSHANVNLHTHIGGRRSVNGLKSTNKQRIHTFARSLLQIRKNSRYANLLVALPPDESWSKFLIYTY